MGRSLYGMLHRRHGRRLTGGERTRRARYFQERLRDSLPLDALEGGMRRGGAAPEVAVVGAGFAGCAAAFTLAANGARVTVFDPAEEPGGRVSSSRGIVPGRILEAGAELIGLNHPMWILLARRFGFGMSVVTPDDDYAGQHLDQPLVLQGTSYDTQQLYEEMTPLMHAWVAEALREVPDARRPWNAPGAPALDAENLGARIPDSLPEWVAYAVRCEFEMNNTVPAERQSWLANLAQFRAGQMDLPDGDGLGFFDDTEVFRCAAGNQALAQALLASQGLPVVRDAVTAFDTGSGGVTLILGDGRARRFDQAVVATSVDAWARMRLDGAPFTQVYPLVGFGPAVKYLAPADTRYWLADSQAPSSMADTLGMTWEGTDNQMDTAGFDLTVFMGGRTAEAAIQAGGTDAYFAPLVRAVYPGFSTPGGTFAHPGETVLRGYSCPAPGEVTGAQKSYATPYQGRLFVAGEHTSPGWFGYMEGALETGYGAARTLLAAAA